MNKIYTESLFKSFPRLYRGKDLPVSQNLMPFGFECGDGWYTLIFDLSQKITEASPDTIAVQVKEKFGGLRFYFECPSLTDIDIVDKLVEEAEEESFKTCETCGSKSNVSQTKNGWIITLCDKCMKKQKK